MSIMIPIRFAGLAVLLSVVSASASDNVAANDIVVWDNSPAMVAAQPAAPSPVAVAVQPVTPAAPDRPVIAAAAEKPVVTDLGAARASIVKRVATPASRLVHRIAPPPSVRLGCSGVWCGRQFVLMLGTAY